MPLSFAQLESYWIQAGGSAALAPIMAAIALAESSGNPSSTNPTDNGGTQTSWGLWQISDGTHNEPAGWSDPLTNARMAVAKYESQGLGAWGTYNSGKYLQFLPGGVSPTPGSAPGNAPTVAGGSTPSFVPRALPSGLTATLVVVIAVLLLFVTLGYHARSAQQ